ncbi:MAG: metallophosphoesterase [Lactobacillus sp.]|jgi:predicted MPP superfamily phosphohydrolase|nr:metallophosphoesterase [Lactobacillus sp.]
MLEIPSGSTFNLGFITDIHYDEGRGRKFAPQMLNNIQDILHYDAVLDAIVFGGDNIDGFQLNKATNVQHLKTFIAKATFPGHSDRWLLNGNHDDGSLRTKDYNWHLPLKEIITRNEFKQLFNTITYSYGEQRDGDSLYFFKDYPTKHVRLIGVDTSDINEATDANSNLLHYRQWEIALQQQQLRWIANVALQNVPKNYHVIFISHAPLDPQPVVFPDHTEIHPNHDLMIQIINSFIDGKLCHVSGNVPDYQVSFDADFRQQGPRFVAGWICGHTHQNADQMQGKLRVIHCRNSVYESAEEIGTADENSFALINLDTVDHQLAVHTIGRGRTIRYFNY